jgi:hypothetical protein
MTIFPFTLGVAFSWRGTQDPPQRVAAPTELTVTPSEKPQDQKAGLALQLQKPQVQTPEPTLPAFPPFKKTKRILF